jgi:hypothetical protein
MAMASVFYAALRDYALLVGVFDELAVAGGIGQV